MTLFSNLGGTRPATQSASGGDTGSDRGGDLRADVRALGASSSRMSEALDPGARTNVDANELHRLSLGNDGRLFWDDKPVVVRRRLMLTFWQKLAMMLVGFGALMIGASAVVHGGIAAHEWMCGAKWVTGYCPRANPPPPAPKPPPLPELPT